MIPYNRSYRRHLRLDRDAGWADTGLRVSVEAGLVDLPTEPVLVVLNATPWEASCPGVTFGSALCRPSKRRDPPEERLAAAQATLEGVPTPDVTVFTDGSATGGVENGGGAP